ncbi:BREX-1 system adenine-specific DNA-methyltransferase PglX [Comamonas thiooxydans]|uniref:BREX-1 system adenine-specific DNA-methyltransferase PglX n=1 Tax=Comamonas thiooxydans TaxID=363952 RepID=UPI001F5EDFAF|nr:BREX-1 system adenine-specific DNA-methyltransferase PglX [Comamonas thiooxydans]
MWWEGEHDGWFGFAKGGAFSPFYSDVFLQVNWSQSGAQIKNNLNDKGGVRSNVWMLRDTANNFFGRPGLTWPRRTNGLSFRVMPQGCIFADKGPAAFVADDAPDALLALCALVSSQAFGLLVSVQLARVELAQSFEVGLIQQTPVPNLNADQQATLAALARRAWSLKRTLDTIEETSHAFALPAALRARLGDYDPPAIGAELARIQAKIDAIAFDLYGFGEADRAAMQTSQGAAKGDAETNADDNADDDGDEEEGAAPIDQTAGLLSWAVGVAFGRFDWRLATSERAAPVEPEPFDSLPARSPGMLPDGAAPFHAHAGILVDDAGHPHDLARLLEDVLARVDAPVPSDVRRWLQRDFFPFHLQRYSKSRRKAPIYWPLATPSGSYTLWVYYPSFTSQTLYTAINDFIEPKLKQVGAGVTALRNKGSARTRDDEKQFESLQSFELELIELRDTLLKLAPTYKPNHDDGVQISAAPLWPLFRHKPWQKVLKDTWAKLAKGDYDWAHLAMNYWPERVREKCKTDKSLAIAHGLEDLYVEPEATPKKARKKKAGGDE